MSDEMTMIRATCGAPSEPQVPDDAQGPISRAEALRIARSTIERAERERREVVEWEAERGTLSEPQVPDDALVGVYAGRIRALEAENAELRHRLDEAMTERNHWEFSAREIWRLRDEIKDALGVHERDPVAAVERALAVIAALKQRIVELELGAS